MREDGNVYAVHKPAPRRASRRTLGPTCIRCGGPCLPAQSRCDVCEHQAVVAAGKRRTA